MGKAVRIIDIDKTGEHFVLKEDVLHSILSKVPPNMSVSVVGVVGAFRTGKSFLLDFFLRYLKNTDGQVLDAGFQREDTQLEWMNNGEKLEGNTSGNFSHLITIFWHDEKGENQLIRGYEWFVNGMRRGSEVG